MLIVQLSDLHCTDAPQFLCDKLTTAVNEINRLSPDLVIISGDLTENGFKTEFEEAKRFIDQIECRQKSLPWAITIQGIRVSCSLKDFLDLHQGFLKPQHIGWCM